MGTRIVLVLLLLLASLPAAAQPGDPAGRIEAARRRAQAAGIPVSLLDSKVAEGRAKNVPAERIAAAVERRLGSLSRAHELMRGPRGEAVGAADLSVGADALEAGVDEGTLRALSASAPATHRAVAVAVLTQLVRDGISSQQALVQVRRALSRNPEELRSLPAAGRGRGRGGQDEDGGRNGETRDGTPRDAGDSQVAPDVRGNGSQASGNRGGSRGGPPPQVPGPGGRGGQGESERGRGGNGNGQGGGKP
jgi:hypothetical protein